MAYGEGQCSGVNDGRENAGKYSPDLCGRLVNSCVLIGTSLE